MNTTDLKKSSTQGFLSTGFIKSVKNKIPAKKNGTHKAFRFHHTAERIMGI
jgi:hypothetical protein